LYLIEIKELLTDLMYMDMKMISNGFKHFKLPLDWIIGRNEIHLLHCHDHHTGLIPFMMLYCKKWQDKECSSMITIHNGLYQGNLVLINYYIPEFDLEHINILEWSLYSRSSHQVRLAVPTVSNYLKWNKSFSQWIRIVI
jgi:starch synthase